MYKSSISSGNLSILYSIAYHTLQKLMYRDVKQGERPRRDLGPQPKVPESRPKITKVFCGFLMEFHCVYGATHCFVKASQVSAVAKSSSKSKFLDLRVAKNCKNESK